MITKTITLKWLKKKQVCYPAQLLFKKIFGEIASAEAVLAWLQGNNKPDWEAWLLAQELGLTKELVEMGADVHIYNDYALKLAALRGDLKIVKFIIVRLGVTDRVKSEVLHWAAVWGNIKVVAFLIEKERATFLRGQKRDAIQKAKERGYTDVVNFIKSFPC